MSKYHQIVKCEYCGLWYDNPIIGKCVAGCGAPLPAPHDWTEDEERDAQRLEPIGVVPGVPVRVLACESTNVAMPLWGGSLVYAEMAANAAAERHGLLWSG